MSLEEREARKTGREEMKQAICVFLDGKRTASGETITSSQHAADCIRRGDVEDMVGVPAESGKLPL